MSLSQTATIVRKIPGGKMVRVDVRFSDTLEYVRITGDFFLFPEDVIDQLEAALVGTRLPLDFPALPGGHRDDVVSKIEAILQANQAELYGVSPQDIVSMLEEALK
jgi:lipoate---protein ligase